MRWTKWTAVYAVMGMMGMAACQPAEEQPPAAEEPAAQAPAAEPGAPAAAPAQLPPGVTQEMVAQGQQIFTGQGNCYTCHGMNAEGSQLAPNLTDDQWLWIDPAQGDLLTQATERIKSGVPQPKEFPAPMPPMGGAQLSDEQVQAVAAYVLSLGGAPQQ
ncbi:MAG TPA: c-type cytochrome [Longimicrobiales bacterium]